MPPSTSIDQKRQYSGEIRSVTEKEPCELCGGHYQCYRFGDAVGCASLDVAPKGWQKLKQDKSDKWIFVPDTGDKPKRAKKTRKTSIPPVELPCPEEVLPLALCPRDDAPEWRATEASDGKERELMIEYVYPNPDTGEPLGKVVRRQWTDRSLRYQTQSGGSIFETKQIRPWHWVKGEAGGWWKDGKGKLQWPLYRQDEVELEIAGGADIVLFYVAGEQAVESARSLGLWAICNQGGEGSYQNQIIEFLERNPPKLFVIWPDHDTTGAGSSTKLLNACRKAGIPTIALNPIKIWSQMPPKGDIKDVVTLSNMQSDEIIRRLEEQIREQVTSGSEDIAADEQGILDKLDNIPDSPNPNVAFTQKLLNFLYGDKPWICSDGKLYQWIGTHYEYSPDSVERRKITGFCNTYAVVSNDQISYPYANPSKVDEGLKWVKYSLEVDSRKLNPAGLNCTNGVLEIHWDVVSSNPVPRWKLVSHDPSKFYTYEPLVKYDPDTNGEACERLLEVLDAPQRDIFLKSIAASLDLATIRQHKGRLVRGLLLKGHGSNGKDTLREVVSMMFGRQGMTGCTLSDFASYDEGRKFPLARLKHSRCNWASENANTTRLDKIQSLKAFITGDTLSAEGKGKDENEFAPTGIALFNVNDTPRLQGTLEAIASRYGVLSFTKTFKIGADPNKGELEADPRFKYDPNFLRSEVLPAFLNRVLDALQRLMVEGIDYSCTQKALEDIQAENSHLFQFCQDTGLGYEPNSILTAGEIWERLEQWYQDNGTLTYEEASNGKQKPVWTEQANPSDRNIKGANQVLGRFQLLFPKAKRVGVTHPNNGKKRVQALQGIGFVSGDNGSDNGGSPTPVLPSPTPVPPQHPPQKTTENQGFHPTHPSFSTPVEKIEETESQVNGVGNIAQKNSDTPQQMGWVGCDDAKSSLLGVGDWGGTGVGTPATGVGESVEGLRAHSPVFNPSYLESDESEADEYALASDWDSCPDSSQPQESCVEECWAYHPRYQDWRYARVTFRSGSEVGVRFTAESKTIKLNRSWVTAFNKDNKPGDPPTKS